MLDGAQFTWEPQTGRFVSGELTDQQIEALRVRQDHAAVLEAMGPASVPKLDPEPEEEEPKAPVRLRVPD